MTSQLMMVRRQAWRYGRQVTERYEHAMEIKTQEARATTSLLIDAAAKFFNVVSTFYPHGSWELYRVFDAYHDGVDNVPLRGASRAH